MLERFLTAVELFAKAWKGSIDNLRATLVEMDSQFGSDLVDAALNQHGISRKEVEGSDTSRLPAVPIELIAKQVVAASKKSVKKAKHRRTGRPAKVKSCLSFTELRPYTFEIVSAYQKGMEFTTRDVAALLEDKFWKGGSGHTFKTTHLCLILTQYIKGIRVIGKKTGKGHPPLNLFRVTGKIRLVRPVTLKKTAK